MTTPQGEDPVPDPDPVPPTVSLITAPEPTATTSTEPVVSHQSTPRPNHPAHSRSLSRDTLAAITRAALLSTTSSPNPPPDPGDNAAENEQASAQEIERSGTPASEILSYEEFPSFESYATRSTFSLTRSLSLGRAGRATKPANGTSPPKGERKPGLFETWLGSPKRTSRAAASPSQTPAQAKADRDAWIGETLSKTQICLWAGPWRCRPSGEFVCPCGEHKMDGDSEWIRVIEEERTGGRSRVGVLRKDLA